MRLVLVIIVPMACQFAPVVLAGEQATRPSSPSSNPSTDGASKDKEALQGVWKMVGATQDGRKATTREVEDDPFVIGFDAERVLVATAKGSPPAPGVYKLDLQKEIKEIDITWTEGSEKGTTWKGIYQFQGKTLRLGLTVRTPTSRPADFDAAGVATMVLERPAK